LDYAEILEFAIYILAMRFAFIIIEEGIGVCGDWERVSENLRMNRPKTYGYWAQDVVAFSCI
jgi:hypothetical protein